MVGIVPVYASANKARAALNYQASALAVPYSAAELQANMVAGISYINAQIAGVIVNT